MTDYKYSHHHNLTLRITKINYNGNYLASIIEIPAIKFQASTREELRKEIRISLKMYFETACDNHEKINVIFRDDLKIDDRMESIKVICFTKVKTKESFKDNTKFKNKRKIILKTSKYVYSRVTYFFLLLLLKK
ncbi:MAG: type II toxin-antitoxin system HicB family antitoxin [Nitrososphaeraceae archaeon]|nr:type II toxin-antitoxin system HicB family antitoxin [Nitrososphaeraceae archaeon]